MVANCIPDGQDIGAWLVENGWALAYRRFSTAYVRQEQAAESAGRGIWRGEFVPPWDWRKMH
jgi:endonuclease YncB( thermonuclease family)